MRFSNGLRWIAAAALVILGFALIRILPPSIGEPSILSVHTLSSEGALFVYDPAGSSNGWYAGVVASFVGVLALVLLISRVIPSAQSSGATNILGVLGYVVAAAAVIAGGYLAYGFVAEPSTEIWCPIESCDLRVNPSDLIRGVLHWYFISLMTLVLLAGVAKKLMRKSASTTT